MKKLAKKPAYFPGINSCNEAGNTFINTNTTSKPGINLTNLIFTSCTISNRIKCLSTHHPSNNPIPIPAFVMQPTRNMGTNKRIYPNATTIKSRLGFCSHHLTALQDNAIKKEAMHNPITTSCNVCTPR